VTERIRIGIDARELLGEKTGVGRYLGELLNRWLVRPDAVGREFILYSPDKLAAFDARVLPGGRGTWWEQTTLRAAARRDRLNAFFAPAYTVPVGLGVPFAVTIHDISFIAHPRWFRPRERWRRRFLTSYAARNAAVVFTDSEFSRSEIEKHLKVKRGQLTVVPPGVTDPGSRPSTRLRAALSLSKGRIPPFDKAQDGPEALEGPHPGNQPPAASRQPLVLYTGSLFNRRRLPDLIAAFALAARSVPDARLVIVGADRTWPRQDLRMVATAHGVAGQVEIREYVDQRELNDLYGRASVFAFLSEYEGFGLTPLEALTAGVPVVVLDTPVAREVYGPAAAYVGHDADSAAAAIKRFLVSPEAAREQLSRAPEVLARYSWDRAADATLGYLDRIARR